MADRHDPQGRKITVSGIFEMRVRALPFVIWLADLQADSYGRIGTKNLADRLICLVSMTRSGSPANYAIRISLGEQVFEAWLELIAGMPSLEMTFQAEEIIRIAEIVRETGKGRDCGKGRVSAHTVIKAIATAA